jgi:hypothetical protein
MRVDVHHLQYQRVDTGLTSRMLTARLTSQHLVTSANTVADNFWLKASFDGCCQQWYLSGNIVTVLFDTDCLSRCLLHIFAGTARFYSNDFWCKGTTTWLAVK